MNHNLILVEGLPCSGKSTTSNFINELLKSEKHNTIWVDEGTGNHPADYEFQSFMDDNDLSLFSKEEQIVLKKAATESKNGYIIELGKLQGDLFDKALQYKIYDFLPWEKEKSLMLHRWQTFVNERGQEAEWIFNCCFLQNPMCETMMRFNMDYKDSKQYIDSIYQIIKPLNPIIIYLSVDSIAENIQQCSQERGEDWLNSVISYHVNGEFGRKRNLSGFDGYVACLKERQQRELKILNSLPCSKLILHNAHKDWASAYEGIKLFLKNDLY